MNDRPVLGTSSSAGVLAAFRAAWPGSDARMIEDAYEAAAWWHRGQRRRSGDPYITHPVAVAIIVAELGMRQEVVCAALLHDVLGDTGCSADWLRTRFGPEVADLVAGVATLDVYEELREAVRRYDAGVLAEVPCGRDVLVLKLADRLHNMRTMRFLPWAKQRRKAQETWEVLAPLAARLGMDAIRWELGQLAAEILHHGRHGVPARTTAHRALSVAAALLPHLARARWLEEWNGELAVLPTRRARARFATQLVCGMPRLALALRRGAPGRIRR